MFSPCMTKSSATFTTAVMSAGGTTCCRPARNLAAPTPPASTQINSGAPWADRQLAVEQLAVGVDHQPYQLSEWCPHLPADRLAGLGRIPDEQVDLGRPVEAL